MTNFNVVPNVIIRFVYKNWRGETATRTAIFKHLQVGDTPYHQGVQFFLYCFCLEKLQPRSFAVKDIAEETFEVIG